MDIFTTDARPFPEYLYGREDEIKRLISLVNTEDFHIALIGGMRRTGKTSLLLSLLKIFTHSKYKEKYNINDAYFPLYIEMDAVKSLEDFNSKLYNRILSNHTWRLIQNTKVEKKVKNVINCFKEKYETFKGYNLSIPSVIGVWASLNFHEFVSNPQPLGFNRITGKPVTPRPFSGITPTHNLGIPRMWGNPHILRYMLRDAFNCLSRVNPHLSQ